MADLSASLNARIGDAERNACISELSDALVDGRLSQDEFDDRSQEAVAARTRDQLAALTVDLSGQQIVQHRDRPSTIELSQTDLYKLGGFVVGSGLLCVLVLGSMIIGDVFAGVLLWLFSLLSGGVGALLARGRGSSSSLGAQAWEFVTETDRIRRVEEDGVGGWSPSR